MALTKIACFLFTTLGVLPCCGALSISKRSTGACPGVLECLVPAQMVLDFINDDDIKPLHTLSYQSILDDVCRRKANISACLDTTHCNSYEVSYKGQAVIAAMNHICGDSYNDFLSEAKCFAHDNAYFAVQLCSKNLLVGFDIYSAQIDTGHAETAGFCRVFDTFFDCADKGIQRFCSKKAADVLKTVYRAAVIPMTNRVGCMLAPL